ncbi:GDP-mannose transporter into the lumen of the Golgi [Coelomomyces lativittatus]|nr:GDP-mannose transporter into the lumen of the Golgi [Coelomomyces lativittatus]
MRRIIKQLNFKDFDTVYYNNFLTAPLFAFLSYFLDDWHLLQTYPKELESFLLAVLFSGIVSFFISYGSAWCVRVVNSTTYSMVGALNKLPISVAGLVVFGDRATFGNISSIIIAFLGGIIYTKAKLNYDRSRLPIKSDLPLVTSDSGIGLSRIKSVEAS